jgi:hypothetical protein
MRTMSELVYKKALEKIAAYRADRDGMLDEWMEADAFHSVQQIAREALDPDERARRIAGTQAMHRSNLRRIGRLNKQARYFMSTFQDQGAWVRFLRGSPTRGHEGIVEVMVIERVGWSFGNDHLKPGHQAEVNVGNLYLSPALEVIP